MDSEELFRIYVTDKLLISRVKSSSKSINIWKMDKSVKAWLEKKYKWSIDVKKNVFSFNGKGEIQMKIKITQNKQIYIQLCQGCRK